MTRLNDALPIASGDAKRLLDRLRAKNPKVVEAMVIASFVARVMQRLRDVRRSACLKQGDVAKLAGMSQARISQFEAVDNPLGPTLGAIAQYARACGFDIEIQIKPTASIVRQVTEFDEALLRRITEPVSLFQIAQNEVTSSADADFVDDEIAEIGMAGGNTRNEPPRISSCVLSRPFVRSPSADRSGSEGRAMLKMMGSRRRPNHQNSTNRDEKR